MYQEITKDFNDLGYDFRINDLDETIEIKTHNRDWERMNDTHEAILKVDMAELGYGGRGKPSLNTMLNSATKLADSQRFNPIRDYFTNLDTATYTPQNGTHAPQPYIIPKFSEYFTNPDKLFGLWLFKWMVGAIAKVIESERNPMLVLSANQGIGKSYLCNWLCPIEGRFVKGPINPDSKDNRLMINDNFIWEVEELGATTRRADIESLKGFITLPFTYERPAYKKHPLRKPAMASFIGTVNNDGAGFLNDPTGSTRFLTCQIDKIDFNYTLMSKDKLWLEALWFYRNVYGSWKLSPEQEKMRLEANQQYELISALEDIIISHLLITHDQDDWLSTQEIRDYISEYYRANSPQLFYNEMGRVGQKLGLNRQRGPRALGSPHGWAGIKKPPSENLADF